MKLFAETVFHKENSLIHAYRHFYIMYTHRMKFFSYLLEPQHCYLTYKVHVTLYSACDTIYRTCHVHWSLS